MSEFHESDVIHVATMAFYRYYKKFIEETPDEDCTYFFKDIEQLVKEELDFAKLAINNGTIEEQKFNLLRFLQKKRSEGEQGNAFSKRSRAKTNQDEARNVFAF